MWECWPAFEVLCQLSYAGFLARRRDSNPQPPAYEAITGSLRPAPFGEVLPACAADVGVRGRETRFRQGDNPERSTPSEGSFAVISEARMLGVAAGMLAVVRPRHRSRTCGDR